ncbi:Bowman-Birk type wound-induced trypsin inhibitor-like [Vicia villosa]|uniref:Bowman-Birk type wound-induced trypsin inhibitor-like n=1 Tax=Vicia villosa TaxID=3911 RepID=UPI00273AF6E2|nr:Bowman-Birk type wound-induced trypsin inhibitor-like [Vicia villosa]
MEFINMKAMMKLAFMLFLLGFTATVADAGLDSTSFINEVLSNGDASNKACCNSCPCTRSIPAQCRCADVGEKCHSACKDCLCTRSLPPKCHCTDVTKFCYKKCN